MLRIYHSASALKKWVATSYRLYAVRVLKIEITRSHAKQRKVFMRAVRVLKTEVTHNRLHNNENKYHVRTSLAKGEQTFARQDDVLREPAAKG